MAFQITKEVSDSVWLAMEARAGFTSRVLPRNRIKTSYREYLAVIDSRTLPNDFPYVYVYCRGDGTSSTPIKSFGTGLAVATYDDPVSVVTPCEIIATFDRIYDDGLSPLEAEINAATHALLILNRDNDTLRMMPGEWRKSRENRKVGGSTRTVVTWAQRIECRPYRSTLIA